jgi:hypothetical protein
MVAVPCGNLVMSGYRTDACSVILATSWLIDVGISWVSVLVMLW